MRVLKSARYGLVRHRVLQRLKRHLSIAYEPYYVIREGGRGAASGWPDLPEGFTASILTAETAHKLVGLAPWFTDQAMTWRFGGGHICVVVEHGPKGTVACTWANPEEVHDRHCSYTLAPGEVYLYDAFVHETARGLGLAPAMRAASYRHLSGLGFTGFISVSDKYNTPALKFKGRLGAEIVAYYECFSIGGRTLWNVERPTERVLPT